MAKKMGKKPLGCALSIKGVEKNYGALKVLQGINLEVKQGEFLAILGRSGCGKSTLLRLIAGLEAVCGGEITHPGETCDSDDIRVLFQESRLIPWKKVWENISLVAKERGRDAAKKFLAQVGLADRMNEWPGILSGGQKQRVALARALSTSPKLLLLDEPLGALDALTRIEMQRLIEGLWQDAGFTVVLVTHDVSEAVALADRVVLMEDGLVTYEEPISLARTRRRDSDFAYYEQRILSRVMETSDTRRTEYSI